MKESREERERKRPKFQALRYLLGNYQKVGIKHKCVIMLTINTIMWALPASVICCGWDVSAGVGLQSVYVVFMHTCLRKKGMSSPFEI